MSANITRLEGTAPNLPQTVTIASHYAYNAAGIRTRVMQTINGVTQKRYFLLDDGHTGYSQIFEETSTLGGNAVRSYVLGDDVLSQTAGSVTSHLLYDGHGSTRQLANGNGEITDSYAYDAYGKMLGGDPNVTDRLSATELLYTGEQFDPGLQMEYLRARYYDQNTGRFNRIDPFAGNNTDPQSLHKYAYAGDDPINYIDPSGNSYLLLIVVIVAVIAVPLLYTLRNASVLMSRVQMERHDIDRAIQAINMYWATYPKMVNLRDRLRADAAEPIDIRLVSTEQFSGAQTRLQGNTMYIDRSVIQESDAAVALVIFGEFQHIPAGGNMNEEEAQAELIRVRNMLPDNVRDDYINTRRHGGTHN